ncbi:MAG: 16S rRNA (guanine(966)-N(2))-methyltransferase RsmD [Chloroflexi bacterium]|nr:16S rRNA (guanine(966)-N(2))-methyltransferase RsmD [Chloroflexota bacterium]
MRVIAGKAKGHRLKGPRARSVRPTSDLVRGAIFSALAARDVDLSRVLDLYAGSGALGIEALSRGACWCDFVEENPSACALIRDNLQATGFAGQAEVHCLPVERALDRLEGPYTLVLADPPYADASALAALEEVASSSLVAPGATLVLEQGAKQAPPEAVGPFRLLNERRHGDTMVAIYR